MTRRYHPTSNPTSAPDDSHRERGPVSYACSMVRTVPSWLAIAAAALAVAAAIGTPSRAVGETLYALELGGSDFRIIDRLTGTDVATISSVLFGSWRGIAMSPTSGVMYATDKESLYRLDLTTGVETEIGLFGSVLIRDLTLDREGLLYGVSGSLGSDPHSLHLIDTSVGAAAALFPLSGVGGHAIAYDPAEPETLYHLAFEAGPSATIFESVDLSSGAATPIPLSGDSIQGVPLGLVYDSIDGLFRLFDDDGFYYTLMRNGVITAVGTQNATVYFGLAFDQLTTRGLLFADGFESGDTSAWSTTVP